MAKKLQNGGWYLWNETTSRPYFDSKDESIYYTTEKIANKILMSLEDKQNWEVRHEDVYELWTGVHGRWNSVKKDTTTKWYVIYTEDQLMTQKIYGPFQPADKAEKWMDQKTSEGWKGDFFLDRTVEPDFLIKGMKILKP